MGLKDDLNEAMKDAMRAKDSLKLGVIRMIRTAVKNREIEERKEIGDPEVISVLSVLAKQRRESAGIFRENGREDLAEKEERELTIIQDFLPAQLSEGEILQIIDAAVAETGASSMKDMGKVMKAVTPRTTGRADGRLVSEMVKARLSQ